MIIDSIHKYKLIHEYTVNIFIKAYIVQISYNNVVERVTGNKYKLTYMDSLFMVILFMGLI